MRTFAQRIPDRRRRGVSLVESVLAASLLAMAVMAVFTAIGSGTDHAQESARRIAATMAAESMLARVILDQGDALDAWNGRFEPMNELQDACGRPLPPNQQVVSRSVEVLNKSRALPGFPTVPGRLVIVEARGRDNQLLASISEWIPDDGGGR